MGLSQWAMPHNSPTIPATTVMWAVKTFEYKIADGKRLVVITQASQVVYRWPEFK
eukprot:c14603_g1_i4 orf=38-202(+)